jgi:1,4-dihydroxy-2-naphthoate octaprenyltransferase
VRLSHRGGGAILQALGVGVVLPLVGYVAQHGGLPAAVLLAPSCLLGFSGHLLTAIPDAEADQRSTKRTLASVRGPRLAAWAAALATALAVVLGASLFAEDATQSAWLTWPPMGLLVAALTQLRSVDAGPRARLRFVVPALGSGTLALLSWAGVLFFS